MWIKINNIHNFMKYSDIENVDYYKNKSNC